MDFTQQFKNWRNGMYRKTVEELQKDQREKLVIDIRSEQDYIKETYPGAKHIFWEEFMEHIGEIPKELPVYLFCYTGQRSDEIAEDLSEQGYEIYSIEGGYRSYLRKKLADFMKEDDGTAERLADKAADAERSIIKKFKKTVWRPFTKAINAYEMIQDGDKIAVCISGGKDSMLMAKLFQELERHGKKNFEVVFLVMNPGYNEVNYQTILNNAKMLNIPITVFRTEIFDTVVDITDADQMVKGFYNWTAPNITRCTYTIAKMEESPVTQSVKDLYIAEVRALRAFFMFDLYRLYGPMPMILEADQAINPDPDYKPYRPTSEEVGTFLTTELRAAADALPVEQAEYGRITK